MRRVSDVVEKSPVEFEHWRDFVRSQAHIFSHSPELFFQQSWNEPIGSCVSGQVRDQGHLFSHPRCWLSRINRADFLHEGQCRQTLADCNRPLAAVTSLACNKDRSVGYSGHSNGKFFRWDLLTGECTGVLNGHTEQFTCLAIASVRGQLVFGSRNGRIGLIDEDSLTELPEDLHSESGCVGCIASSRSGEVIVSGWWSGGVVVHECCGGQWKNERFEFGSRVASVDCSADGTIVVAAFADGRIWIMDRNRKHTRTINATAKIDHFLALFHGDASGLLLASCSQTGALSVWNVSNGTRLLNRKGPKMHVTRLRVSGDGRLALAGTWDNRVCVWELASGSILRFMYGHSSMVTDVAFLGDRVSALSGACDGTVKIWDLAKSPSERFHTERIDRVDFADLDAMTRGEDEPDQEDAWKQPESTKALKLTHMVAVSQSTDSTVFWDLTTGKTVNQYPGTQKPTTIRDYFPQEERWNIVLTNAEAKIRDPATGETLATLPGSFTAAKASPDGRYLVFANATKQVELYELNIR